ncbi:MAG: hypothetical protein M1406_08210 [Nitrospirae bacterium]|nr:hypothetical protein [Nitrospirota bacterium]
MSLRIAGGENINIQLRKTIITAFLLFVADAFVLNQFTIALFTIILGVPALIVKLFRARKDGERKKLLVSKAGIYALMVVLIIGANIFNNMIAERRAKDIIAACEQFKTKSGRYPEKLSELVPEYLHAVPAAKYSLMGASFRYFARQESHALMYEAIPPYGRKYYVFEKKAWESVD